MIGDNLNCERCGHKWLQRGSSEPKFCPKCKSPYWQKPLNAYWKKRRQQIQEKK